MFNLTKPCEAGNATRSLRWLTTDFEELHVGSGIGSVVVIHSIVGPTTAGMSEQMVDCDPLHTIEKAGAIIEAEDAVRTEDKIIQLQALSFDKGEDRN
jgi:hypothetical protein